MTNKRCNGRTNPSIDLYFTLLDNMMTLFICVCAISISCQQPVFFSKQIEMVLQLQFLYLILY